ncbi:MAG: L-2-amino-thiazoline-4-carboxylic acid hydrolase [Ketobacteraceae bacterium]|nr:L-2-amino-thiazoline-4-carboxylic acid hydrolase [Ketobacteraceae bacterium]
MLNSIRLYYFDVTQGNKTGIKVLANRFGLKKALTLGMKLQWQMLVASPFRSLNAAHKPDRNQKLSQRQMAPVIILYQDFQEMGLSRDESLEVLRELISEVATGFLKFNIPTIKKSEYSAIPQTEKLQLLRRLTGRFFNAEADLTLDKSDNFTFSVHHCHFASYCKTLNLPELAPLFCAADKQFFDDYQDDIVFFRTRTLANGDSHCDFRFTWQSDAD